MSENNLKPWENEPNELFLKHSGLRCAVIRHRSLGTLCGYVRLPAGPLAEAVKAFTRKFRKPLKNIFNIPNFHKSSFSKVRRREGYDAPVLRNVEVHGGLTFSSSRCRHYRMRRGLWVGFDCAHAGDHIPFMDQFLPAESVLFKEDCYADVAFVSESLRQLTAQLVALNQGLLNKSKRFDKF